MTVTLTLTRTLSLTRRSASEAASQRSQRSRARPRQERGLERGSGSQLERGDSWRGSGRGTGEASPEAARDCAASVVQALPHTLTPTLPPPPNLPPTLTLTLTASVVQAAARGRSARARSPVLGPSAGRSESVTALRDMPARRRDGEALPHSPHPMSGRSLASSSSLVLEGSLSSTRVPEGLHHPAHHPVATGARARHPSDAAAADSHQGGGGVLHMPIFERLMQACTVQIHTHAPHVACAYAHAHARMHMHMHMHMHTHTCRC